MKRKTTSKNISGMYRLTARETRMLTGVKIMLKEKAKETDVIFHIRKPLRKQRGNQYYYDYSDRGQGNYCGSPETSFDIPHKSEARSWSSLQTHYVPCQQCCRIRAFGKTGGK